MLTNKNTYIYIFLFVITLTNIHGSRIDKFTFSPPYSSVDEQGMRVVSQGWRTCGSASVNQNFVRLTPELQSKKGALWSKNSLETDKISAILTFRISGQDRKLFGDGLAIWFLKYQNFFPQGNLHGIDEKFEGFGVVFDTFKNLENINYHKDVSVLVNNKFKKTEHILAMSKGCNASIRYHADRADFTVMNSSRAKIILSDLSLSVFIDERNTGEWKECTKVELPFNSGWSKQAYIGISASTGELVDNHDIISFVAYSDHQILIEEDEVMRDLPKFLIDEDAPIDERLVNIEEEVEKILTKLDMIQHHFEHKIVDVEDGIKTAINKLRNEEQNSKGRLETLERNVLNEVDVSVTNRLENLESILSRSIIHKLAALEKQIDSTASSRISDSISPALGWKLPFSILILTVGISAIMIYRWYIKFTKTHFL